MPNYQAVDGDGSGFPGAKLYFYTANTTAPLDTFSDATLLVANSNPVVADPNGRFGPIFLGAGTYDVLCKDANDAAIWEADDVAVPALTAASTTSPGVIEIATQSEANAGTSALLAMTPATTAGALQSGAFTYAADTGAANVYVATLAPVPSAYGSGMEVFIRFSNSNTAASTLNVNGLGAIAIKKAGRSGYDALVAGDIITGVAYTLFYSNADSCWVLVNPSARQIVALPGCVGFTAISNTGTPNTKIDVTAAVAIAIDANNYSRVASAVTKTLDCTTGTGGTSTANGMDGTALANSTWYYLWLILKDDGTVALLGSTSATAPTLPTGYTFKVRVGSFRTDGAAHILRFQQAGREIFYLVLSTGTVTALPTVVVTANSQTRTAASISSVVPPTAAKIKLVVPVLNVNNSAIAVAPNLDAGYTAASSITAPAIFSCQQNTGPNTYTTGVFEMGIESTNIYYSTSSAATTSNSIFCYGYTDTVPCF